MADTPPAPSIFSAVAALCSLGGSSPVAATAGPQPRPVAELQPRPAVNPSGPASTPQQIAPAPVPADWVSPWRLWLEVQPVRFITTLADWQAALTAAGRAGVVSLDFETTGLDPRQARIRTAQIAWPCAARLLAEDGRSPAPDAAAEGVVLDLWALDEAARGEVLEGLAQVAAAAEVVKIGHGLRFDLGMLRAGLGGRRLPLQSLFDTLLAEQVIAAGDFVPGRRMARLGLEQVPTKEAKQTVEAAGKAHQQRRWYRDAHGHLVEFKRAKSEPGQPEADRWQETMNLQQVVHRHLEVWLDKSLQAEGWEGELSPERVRYAAWDALALLPLQEIQVELLRRNNLADVAALEFDVIPATVEMELTGLWVDTGAIREFLAAATERLEGVAADLREFGGENFNPQSAPQAIALLRDLAQKAGRLQGDKIVVAGEKFECSTDKRTAKPLLAALQGQDTPATAQIREFLSRLLEYRRWKKYQEYAEGYLKTVGTDGRVRGGYFQMDTATGRFASSNPNAQQIPKRGEGRAVRNLFAAPAGRVLVRSDYSMIEVRIMAALSGDPELCRIFAEGGDVHRETGATLLEKAAEAITDDERDKAKAAVFGLLYGMKAPGFRRFAAVGYDVALTPSEAETWRSRFFARYRRVEAYHRRQDREGMKPVSIWRHTWEKGFHEVKRAAVRSLGNRLRVWPLAHKFDPMTGAWVVEAECSKNELYNTPDQATGADMVKRALVTLYREVLALGWEDVRLCATVHDEIVVEAPEALAEDIRVLVEQAMVTAGQPLIRGVPCVVEATVKRRWGEK